MKKGIIFGIGIGILLIGIVVGMGVGSTTSGIPGLGGLPNSDDNQMSMSDSVQVSVVKGESVNPEESIDSETTESKAIDVNIEDGTGAGEQN